MPTTNPPISEQRKLLWDGWIRGSGSAVLASAIVCTVGWLTGFVGIPAIVHTLEGLIPRVAHLEEVEKDVVDHESRVRLLEHAIDGMKADLGWVRAALRTGRDPQTGEVLPGR